MKNSILIIAAILMGSFIAQGQMIDNSFFQQADKVFKAYVVNGSVNYKGIEKDADFKQLINTISISDYTKLDSESKQAYLINAYNLLVINGVVKNGIRQSVQEKSSFFDAKKSALNGKKVSLNTIEKKYLLKEYGDPRFHFVLVCGALDCPPITNFAYTPTLLEKQLEAQTRAAINDPQFIRVSKLTKRVSLSQIFSWYASDFGGSKKEVLKFINKYRKEAIPASFTTDYYDYDWGLNNLKNADTSVAPSGGANSARYVVSAAIPKGGIEIKAFNNLYTQKTRSAPEEAFDSRSNFFTTAFSFLYGVSGRFNAGFDLRYRRVSNTDANTSPFNVLTNKADNRRHGFTSIGPKIRWAPFQKLENFSIQSAFTFPVGDDLEGADNKPYIDWDGAAWNTQVFNDFSIGTAFSIFTEVDFLLEDIGKKEDGDLNRFSTPVTTIFSYFPNPKTTLYVLGSYSPYWQKDYDYFAQAGFGAKYQITPNFEVEGLYSAFTNEFLSDNNGQASTFNLGVRISR